MRRILLSFAILIVAMPIYAAETTEKPKTRTLQELIELVIKEGRDRKIGPNTASGLGFPEAELSVKAVRYTSKQTQDQREHDFNVVYETSESQEFKPIALIWGITKSTVTSEGKFLDGSSFRVSLNGKLENAFTVTGKVGELDRSILSVGSRKTKNSFKQELEFWLKDSIPLELDTGRRK